MNEERTVTAARMWAIDKVQELRDPQRFHDEIAEMYRREGLDPEDFLSVGELKDLRAQLLSALERQDNELLVAMFEDLLDTMRDVYAHWNGEPL